MIRLIAVAFALVVATSAQAIPVGQLHQPDGMVTQVRGACGAVGYELMVSAWPEPPSAMSAERSADVRDGTQAFAFATTETPPNRPGRKRAAFKGSQLPRQIFAVSTMHKGSG